jgi:predicted nucleic acid-binding Zn ribbon protein
MPTANYKNTITGEVIEYYTKGSLEEEITVNDVKHTRDYGKCNVDFKFKGPGFYQTDYKDKEKKAAPSDG